MDKDIKQRMDEGFNEVRSEINQLKKTLCHIKEPSMKKKPRQVRSGSFF